MVSDNGPPFNSHQFQTFTKEWGFNHKTSSPHYPQSNGLAEKSVAIVKNILRKAGIDGLSAGLMEYRASPISGSNVSPSEIMMGRIIRTKIPATGEALNNAKHHLNLRDVHQEKSLIRQQHYYNRGTKRLPDLTTGDQVRVRVDREKTWKPAVVTDADKDIRSYKVITENGAEYRRNRRHLQKCEHSKIITGHDNQWEVSETPVEERNRFGNANTDIMVDHDENPEVPDPENEPVRRSQRITKGVPPTRLNYVKF